MFTKNLAMFNRKNYIQQRRVHKLQTNSQAIELIHQIIAKEHSIDDDVSREAIIAKEVNVTTWQSFCRFGDRNHASRTLKRNWIHPKGIALDVQAMFITEEYHCEILPDELAAFISAHEGGKAYYHPYQELNQLKQAFTEITGFRWDWNPRFFKNQIIKPLKTADILEENYF